MTELSKSYLKVPYDLRPAKQAERRMLLDAFQILASSGFDIRSYQYTGMGSIHFVDFILLHKYFGISRLVSVEISKSIAKRIKFNCPFALVVTHIMPIGEYIPKLSDDLRHILWLDYDSVISEWLLSDVSLAASLLSPGSMLLITIDGEPPGGPTDGAIEWFKYFSEHASAYLKSTITPNDFSKMNLPKICVDIVAKAISQGMKARKGLRFRPVFNFSYADGHRMLTLGGMICDEASEAKLDGSGIDQACYYRDDFDAEPFSISVPVLTRKERIFLDAGMPCQDSWNPKDFEIDSETIRKYREVYRFLPSYIETYL